MSEKEIDGALATEAQIYDTNEKDLEIQLIHAFRGRYFGTLRSSASVNVVFHWWIASKMVFVTALEIFVDSMLIAMTLFGEYVAKKILHYKKVWAALSF